MPLFFLDFSFFTPLFTYSTSNEFHMTEAQAGVMITAYSWTVTLLSLPLMLLVCRIQPKKLLLGTLSVFAVCQVLSVISSGFTFLVFTKNAEIVIPINGSHSRKVIFVFIYIILSNYVKNHYLPANNYSIMRCTVSIKYISKIVEPKMNF